MWSTLAPGSAELNHPLSGRVSQSGGFAPRVDSVVAGWSSKLPRVLVPVQIGTKANLLWIDLKFLFAKN